MSGKLMPIEWLRRARERKGKGGGKANRRGREKIVAISVIGGKEKKALRERQL